MESKSLIEKLWLKRLDLIYFCYPFVSFRLEGLMDLYSQGYERSYTVNSSILNAIEPHLKDFQQLLLDPPKVKKQQSGRRRKYLAFSHVTSVCSTKVEGHLTQGCEGLENTSNSDLTFCFLCPRNTTMRLF